MPDFSPAARLRSFVYAARGLRALLASQPNAWIHLCATLCVIAVASYARVERRDGAVLVLCIALVWSTEALNSALEALCDRLAPEPHPLIARAKDLAAAAVLIAAALSALIGFLLMGPPLWHRLTGS